VSAASTPPLASAPGLTVNAGKADAEDARWRERLQGGPFSPAEARAFATFALNRVSRTFALNIQVLPEPLRGQVLHAYLYCRMADTLEDDPELPAAEKSTLLHVFGALFNPDLKVDIHDASVQAFPTLLPASWRTSTEWEKILLARAPLVLAAYPRYPNEIRKALAACVRTMCTGMGDFALRQERITRAETPHEALIETMADLDRYCWFVAGTVGVMLCDLFIAYGRIPEPQAARMRARHVSFGSGLQLVNILKDLADDRARGVSWIPGSLLTETGLSVADLDRADASPEVKQSVRTVHATLFAKALNHLEEALEYTLAIPRHQRSLRLFCLWPLLMAAETLDLLVENAMGNAVRSGGEARLKITRARVARIVRTTGLLWWSDRWLRAEFERSARRIRFALHESPPAHTFGKP